MRICLTCASGALKQQEGFFLKNYSKYRNNIDLIGADIYPKKINRRIFDYSIRLLKPNNQNYMNRLLRMIRKYKIEIIIVNSDKEAIKITKNIKKISKYKCKVLLNKFSTIRILSNKILTYRSLASIKKIIPEWKEVKNEKILKLTLKRFMYKFGSAVIKPAVSAGGRDVFIIEKKNKKKKNKIGRMKEVNYKEFLSKYLKKIKKKFPLIVMEKLYEPIFDLDILSSKGKIINAVFRKRIIPKDPNSGHKIIYNKQILSSAMKISKLLNLNYINDCDFMIDRNKDFKLLEINPRPSGSLAIPHIAGFPILDNLLDFCLGGKNFTKASFFKKNVTISKKRINNYIFQNNNFFLPT